MNRTLLAVPGIENLSDAGKRAVLTVADALGTDPDYLVTIMSFETGHTFSPAEKNKAGSGATGMIQFMPSTAGALGYTTAQLAQMTQEEQILGPVYKYFQGKGKLNTVDDAYLAVFFPSAMRQPDDYIIGVKEGGTDFQAKVYAQNAGFDRSGTGVIRRSDVTGAIRSVYNGAQNKPRVNVTDAPLLWRPIFNIALFGAFALSAYVIVQWGRDKPIKSPQKLLAEVV